MPIDLRVVQKHFISLLPVMEADLFLMGIDGKLIRNLSFVLLSAPTLLLLLPLRAPINFPHSYVCIAWHFPFERRLATECTRACLLFSISLTARIKSTLHFHQRRVVKSFINLVNFMFLNGSLINYEKKRADNAQRRIYMDINEGIFIF
jgi:hypothetical protein